MNYPVGFDPVADFEQRWPADHKPINATMVAFRKLSRAQAYNLKAQIDLEAAMRMVFEAEAELEFVKMASGRRGN